MKIIEGFLSLFASILRKRISSIDLSFLSILSIFLSSIFGDWNFRRSIVSSINILARFRRKKKRASTFLIELIFTQLEDEKLARMIWNMQTNCDGVKVDSSEVFSRNALRKKKKAKVGLIFKILDISFEYVARDCDSFISNSNYIEYLPSCRTLDALVDSLLSVTSLWV